MRHHLLIRASIVAIQLVATRSAYAEIRAALNTNKLPAQGETLVWSPLFQAS